MSYDIVFLSRLIPKEMDFEIRKKMINSMEDAAISWQFHLIEGIDINNKTPVKLLNYIPVNSYPKSYKDPIIKRVKFSHVVGAQDINLGYINVKFIKRAVQWIPLRKELKKWVKKTSSKQKVILAYTMYPEFLKAFQWIKKNYPEIITINIVVDMPQFINLSNDKKSFLGTMFLNRCIHIAQNSIKFTDGFITITKQMAEKISINKPYKIIEGICTNEFSKPAINNHDLHQSIIYAGLLHEKFGIRELLDAFQLLDNPNILLKICGIGDLEEEIKERAKKDKRIKFLGKITHDEVLNELLTSSLIINPRKNIGEFTKYSFPSKNIEGLSSGIPFIGYKLDGISDEYDRYINYPENNSINALKELISKILEQDYEKYKANAKVAQKWIFSNKNCVIQGKKVFDLIDDIINM